MKRALITGGCGFVGTNLVEYLLERTDWYLTVLDNLDVGKLEYLQGVKGYTEERVTFIQGDIRDEEAVDEAVKNVDYIINLAAQTSVIDSIEEPMRDADINIEGTINLLEHGLDEDIDRFIQASSAAPLGEQEMPIHEGKVPQPMAPYGASKLACEGYCSAYSGSHGLETVALRFSNVYGPKSWHKGSVVSKFIKQIIDGETPTIYGDGGQTRDFIHTEDISQALHLACVEQLDQKYELFQVATGRETSINELYDLIEDKLEKHEVEVPEPIYGDARSGEIYRNYAEIDKIKEELGYEPKVGLEDGIEETVEWFMENY